MQLNFRNGFLEHSLFYIFSLLARANLCTKVYQSEEIQFLRESVYLGTEIQAKLAKLISQATKSIAMEMTLTTNHLIYGLIKEKAKQGVEIRIVMDGRHAKRSPGHLARFLKVQSDLSSLGGQVVMINADHLQAVRLYPGASLHRKFIIVDELYVYVGSANFTEKQNNEVGFFGPLASVPELLSIFNQDLESAINNRYQGFNYLKQKSSQQKSDLRVGLVGPGTTTPDTKGFLIDGIRRAKKRILISAFEATDPEVLKYLIQKKLKYPETDIRVVLCSSELSVWAMKKEFTNPKNNYYAQELSRNGISVRIYDHEGSYNHARLSVFDDLVFGTSSDFNYRSFNGHIELGFSLKDSRVSLLVQESFDKIWSLSRDLKATKLKDSATERLWMLSEQIYRLLFIMQTKVFY